MAEQITQEHRDLIQQFLTKYNALDAEFRRQLGLGREIPFSKVVNQFSAKHWKWVDVEFLRTVNDLRNLLVHEPKRPYDYIAVPTSELLTKLGTVCDQILHPERVMPKFARKVVTVGPADSLADVLRRISTYDFSQFPIYGESFDGLLTENGITRWLAHHVTTELSMVELEEVFVRDIIPEEEKRANWKFVSRKETVDAVRDLFADKELLEAVLITQSGNRRESLLGIVTRWDIIR